MGREGPSNDRRSDMDERLVGMRFISLSHVTAVYDSFGLLVTSCHFTLPITSQLMKGRRSPVYYPFTLPY